MQLRKLWSPQGREVLAFQEEAEGCRGTELTQDQPWQVQHTRPSPEGHAWHENSPHGGSRELVSSPPSPQATARSSIHRVRVLETEPHGPKPHPPAQTHSLL